MEEKLETAVQERAVLVGLNADCFSEEQTATEESLKELEDLLETAGGFCTGKVLQNRHTPDSHSFIGEGKAQEIRMLAEATQSTMVIFDNELSPGNIRALEEIIGVTVIDRSALILDIFAQRAKTKEGRLQVELAQYKYLLPRLSGMGASLSRQGGGIGTRGPGETKLESDRRHIRERITRLESELAQVRQVRGVQRERRRKNSVPVVAIVGYTNAGKSTLLNQLTGAGIPANNRLFDTLDTTSRQLTVSMGGMMTLIDGFAVGIFFVLIYLLSKIIIEKNAQSISMTKILGYTGGEIAGLYIIPTSIMTVLFLVLSLPIEYEIMVWLFREVMLQSMSGWIPLYIDPMVYVKMLALGLLAYGVVAATELRKIRKIPMNEALKNAE